MVDKGIWWLTTSICNAVCIQNTIQWWTKEMWPQNHQTIQKHVFYIALLLNHIESGNKKILMKNKNGFRRKRSTTDQILTIHRIKITSYLKNQPSKMNKTCGTIWRSWPPTHRCTSVDLPARIYLHHICADTGFSLEELPGAMDDRGEWRKCQGNAYCQRDLMMTVILYFKK